MFDFNVATSAKFDKSRFTPLSSKYESYDFTSMNNIIFSQAYTNYKRNGPQIALTFK